jgi:large subunit ribosomal protein L2
MKILKPSIFANSVRHQIKIQKNLLTKKNNILKNLLKYFISKNGRSSITGHITVRHKGSSCKHKIHILNSLRIYFGFNVSHMYSSYHNSFISLNFDFLTKSFFKTISTKNVFPGSILVSDYNYNEFHIGYRMQLRFLPIGSIIHLIGLFPNTIYGNAAGTFCQLIENRICSKIRLPSGKLISLPFIYFATLGRTINIKNKLLVVGKAGRNRLIGIRPTVRGIAMNPVDHPHGGRTNGGMCPMTPWGIPTKGKPTVRKKYE